MILISIAIQVQCQYLSFNHGISHIFVHFMIELAIHLLQYGEHTWIQINCPCIIWLIIDELLNLRCRHGAGIEAHCESLHGLTLVCAHSHYAVHVCRIPLQLTLFLAYQRSICLDRFQRETDSTTMHVLCEIGCGHCISCS